MKFRLPHIHLSILCLAFAILTLALGLVVYRHNLVHAYKLEREILAADVAGQDSKDQIQQLKQYSEHHMHASVSFTLESSYSRDLKAAHDQAADDQLENINSELYAAAQTVCGERTDSVQKAHCVIDYVHAHQPANGQIMAKPEERPKRSDYTYTFTSPPWAWDAAGISFILSAVSLGAAVILALRHR